MLSFEQSPLIRSFSYSDLDNGNVTKKKRRRFMLGVGTIIFCFALVIGFIPHSTAPDIEPVENKEQQGADRAKRYFLSSLNAWDTEAEPGCEANVILIRHCEKQSLVDDSQWAHENCNAIGFRRAEYLATLFGDNVTDRWPSPDYLFAQSPNHRHSNRRHLKASREIETLDPPSNQRHLKVLREVQTIEPLSAKFNIPIVTNYTRATKGNLTESILDVLRKGELCGKLTIICWDHAEIPHIAQKLGCGPFNGCPVSYESLDYDHVWQINFRYEPLHDTGNEQGTSIKFESPPAGWNVFGTVVSQDFDPLRFQKYLE